jgi:hypothetical protein
MYFPIPSYPFVVTIGAVVRGEDAHLSTFGMDCRGLIFLWFYGRAGLGATAPLSGVCNNRRSAQGASQEVVRTGA